MTSLPTDYASIKFEIDELEANPKSKIIISIPKTTLTEGTINTATSSARPVTGFIQSELQISVGAEYNTPFESSAQDSLTGMIQKFQGALSTLGFTDQPAITLKTFAQTVNNWTGTSRPQFTQNIVFVRTREDPNNDVRIRVKRLYETVVPATKNFLFAGTMQPPLNYLPILSPDKQNKARGTMVIAVGEWFSAVNQVMRNVNFSFSKQVVKDGSPLYAVGSITFEPYRMPSRDEFMAYFSSVSSR